MHTNLKYGKNKNPSIPQNIAIIFAQQFGNTGVISVRYLLSLCFMAGKSLRDLTETSTRNISWGKRRPMRSANNHTTFMCRLSSNLGASTSWNLQGLSRPVMGLLYPIAFGIRKIIKVG
jgi:hypothetical protein